jgi:hypothetical protein
MIFKKANYHEIDIHTCSYDPPFFAKIIWEGLFRMVEAEKFKSLYEFLCDIRGIERMIEEGHNIIYWAFDYNGITDVSYILPMQRNYIKIHLSWEEKKIILERS